MEKEEKSPLTEAKSPLTEEKSLLTEEKSPQVEDPPIVEQKRKVEEVLEPATALEPKKAKTEALPEDPLLAKLTAAIAKLLSTADLSVMTTRIVRKSLEESFNVSLKEHKNFIKAQVAQLLSTMDLPAETAETATTVVAVLPLSMDISTQLVDPDTSEDIVLALLQDLSSRTLTMDELISYNLATSVPTLRNHKNSSIADTARDLRKRWKSLTKQPELDVKGLLAVLTSTSSSDEELLLSTLTDLEPLEVSTELMPEVLEVLDKVAQLKLQNEALSSVLHKVQTKWTIDGKDQTPEIHVEYLRGVLEKESTSTSTKLTAMQELAQMQQLTVELVISSKIGHVISTLRKSTDSSIAAAAKRLRAQWKREFARK